MEWTDIINQVLDEQSQPVAMKRPGNDNLEKMMGGGGGGYSGGAPASQLMITGPPPAANPYRGSVDPISRTNMMNLQPGAAMPTIGNRPSRGPANRNKRIHAVPPEDY